MTKKNKANLEDFKLYREAREFSKKAAAAAAKLPQLEQDRLAQRLQREAAGVTGLIVRGFRCWCVSEEKGAAPAANGEPEKHISGMAAQNVCYFGKFSQTTGQKAIVSLEKVITDLNACFMAGYTGRQETIDLKLAAYGLISHINRYVSYCRRCMQRSVHISNVS